MLSAEDLDLIARMQEFPPPTMRDIGADLGISMGSVWRKVRRLREMGVVSPPRFLVCAPTWRMETLSLLQLRLDQPQDVAALERRIIDDPAVWSAERIVGVFDLQIRAFHEDLIEAREWVSTYEVDPAVLRIKPSLCKTIQERPPSARVLLSGAS